MEKLAIKCSKCDKDFTLRKNLNAHLRKVHKIEPPESKELQPAFECRSCNKKFVYRSSLNRHIKGLHLPANDGNYDQLLGSIKGNRLICPQQICGAKFLKYTNLRQHLKDQHDVNIEFEELTFNCVADFEKWKSQIQHETQSLYTLDTGVRPLLNGASKKVYNCHRSYSYKHKNKKVQKFSTATSKMGRACPARIEVIFHNDAQSTISIKFWKTHCGHIEQIGRVKYNELSDGRIECDACKMIFFMRHHYETHTCNEKIKKTKTLSCPHCLKTFSSRFNLRRHVHSHSNEKPCECDTCKKRFVRKETLTRHLLTHSDKLFKCKICYESFLQADILNEHMKSHPGEKPFVCDQCGKRFTRKHSVFIHVKCVHKDDSKLLEKCNICNEEFEQKDKLVEHMKAHIKTECEVTETKVSGEFYSTSDDKPIGSDVKVKEEELFIEVDEHVVKFEDKSLELSEAIVPKLEPKEEYFEIETFAYLTAGIGEDTHNS